MIILSLIGVIATLRLGQGIFPGRLQNEIQKEKGERKKSFAAKYCDPNDPHE